MIACTIEFGVKSGKEEKLKDVLENLLSQMHRIDGFISKESFDSRNNPGKVLTISYWRDEDALEGWNNDPDHREAMHLGIKELFTHYNIQISKITRARNWQAPD